MRTRTVVVQAHTSQDLGTFSGAGNGDYRGELGRAKSAISAYMKASSLPLNQALLRLDGLYGNGAIVADLAGCAFVMRGKDYHLLDLPAIQARVQASPDAVMTHPETGTQRARFDFPCLPVTAAGDSCRLVVATHPTSTQSAPVGETRDHVVYELFFTALPGGAFTAADVVTLSLHRGAFETLLSDEDQEQDPDRWCSHRRLPTGILANPLPMGVESTPGIRPCSSSDSHAHHRVCACPSGCSGGAGACAASTTHLWVPAGSCAIAHGVFAWKSLPAASVTCPLRCPENHPLYPQERRLEHDGTLRVMYAARIGHCRCCP